MADSTAALTRHSPANRAYHPRAGPAPITPKARSHLSSALGVTFAAQYHLSNAKVPIRWPRSWDKVWEANIPHNLASAKSDQRWMVVNGDKIKDWRVSSSNFAEDNEIWGSRVIQYWKHIKPEMHKDSFRNIMDMNANLG